MKKNYFIILIVFGFFSCQKEISNTTATTTGVEVYVAGYETNNAGVSVAKYWKNGQAKSLTDGTREAFSFPSITVVGSDVYMAGGEIESFNGPLGRIDNYVAKYWKNGQAVSLTDVTTGTALAQSIAVVGSDVYVLGDGKYWKNGQAIILSNNHWCVGRGIAVVGSGVYVAGAEVWGSSGNYGAIYWKNGQAIALTDGTKYSWTTSIAVAGNDVYVAGVELNGSHDEAKYWKNRQAITLTDGTKESYANSIVVVGTDVYVAGFENNGAVDVAKYWKNGIPVILSDGTKNENATSIAVSGTDVYVAGNEEKTAGSFEYVAKYWKNGIPIILGDVSKYSGASSIFLVKK